MKAPPPHLAGLLLVVFLSGCAIAPPTALPPAARNVELGSVSSRKVEVHPPLLSMQNGRLELAGTVAKIYGADTTAGSHLDLVFFGPSGLVLQTMTAQFAPRNLTRGRRAPNRTGYYALPVAPLPEGTVRIEVRAHDGNHGEPHG